MVCMSGGLGLKYQDQYIKEGSLQRKPGSLALCLRSGNSCNNTGGAPTFKDRQRHSQLRFKSSLPSVYGLFPPWVSGKVKNWIVSVSQACSLLMMMGLVAFDYTELWIAILGESCRYNVGIYIVSEVRFTSRGQFTQVLLSSETCPAGST